MADLAGLQKIGRQKNPRNPSEDPESLKITEDTNKDPRKTDN